MEGKECEGIKIYDWNNMIKESISEGEFEIAIVLKNSTTFSVIVGESMKSKVNTVSINYEYYKVLNKILQEMQKNIEVKFESFYGYESILIDRIVFIESKDKYTEVNTVKGKRTAKRKLYEWENSLNIRTNIFYRIHKSYIINMKHVDKISQNILFLSNGTHLQLSRRRRHEFLEAFNRYKLSTKPPLAN